MVVDFRGRRGPFGQRDLRGIRLHAPDAILVRRFDDYVAKLEAAKVILDAERRKRIIFDDAKNLAFARGWKSVEDEACWKKSRACSNGRRAARRV